MSTMPGTKKYVIYTAIFGKFDNLQQPTYIPKNCDFVCFTDQPLQSRIWKIVRVEPPVPGDGTRSNRYYKMLPHKFFNEYEISIYIDGNVQVVGDITQLADQYLQNNPMAALSHAHFKNIPLATLKEHMDHLTMPGQEKKHGEDFALIKRQYDFYLKEGFPDTDPLIMGGFLFRRHNNPRVIDLMEAWWEELTRWSKRDQMSFNYVAWKKNFQVAYIPLDGTRNQYFRRVNHALTPRQMVRSYLLGAMKRLKALFGTLKK